MNVWKRIQNEPAAAIGIVGAFMSMLVLFGVPLSDTQQGAVTGFLFLVAGFLTRQLVTPVVTVDAKVDAAVEDALTAESAPLTAEQRQLVDDLKAIIATLRSAEMTRDKRTAATLLIARAAKGRTP